MSTKRNSEGQVTAVTSPGSDSGNSESNTLTNNTGIEDHMEKKFKHSHGDEDEDEDEDGDVDDEAPKSGKRAGRRKIKIEYIEDKSRRHITFSKRKSGIMKKAYELSTLTGTQVLLLVVSETGLVYTFTTPKLQPLVTKAEGKNLIQACLHAPDKDLASDNGPAADAESPEEDTREYEGRGGASPQANGGSSQGSPGQTSPQQPPQPQPPSSTYGNSASMNVPSYPPPYNHIPFPAQYNYPNMGMHYQNAPPNGAHPPPHPSYGGGQYWSGPPHSHAVPQQASPKGRKIEN
ncbi:hypothetical protein B0O80DRAFT_464484 [Mortierella sp. GBAus27b]|nr:transcription factor of the MADS box [Mortierella sp. GBA43]KAI8347842.1 hypothetical protein B0O80DRAFT_464484 [Mortierella sp. GBAus27b]